MGTRGPLPGARVAGPLTARTAGVAARRSDPPPRPPTGLGTAGRRVWKAAWSAGWLDVDQDGPAVAELCRLEDELALYRAALAAHGALLSEPVVSPTGVVVGERLVANPAEAMLRRADRAASEIRTLLGLSPTGRARLGLQLIEAERKVSALERLMEERQRR